MAIVKPKLTKFVFDATGGKATGTHVLGKLPAGAKILHAWYNVTTTFTTASADAGTIALTTGKDAGDLVAALAVSNAANIWDAGLHSTKVPAGAVVATQVIDDTYGNPENIALTGAQTTLNAVRERGTPGYIALTADSSVAVVVATQALTAGVLELYLEWVD